MSEDRKARDAIEGSETKAKEKAPAGPHAKEHLIDKSKTPGSGSLADDKTTPEADVGPD